MDPTVKLLLLVNGLAIATLVAHLATFLYHKARHQETAEDLVLLKADVAQLKPVAIQAAKAELAALEKVPPTLPPPPKAGGFARPLALVILLITAIAGGLIAAAIFGNAGCTPAQGAQAKSAVQQFFTCEAPDLILNIVDAAKNATGPNAQAAFNQQLDAMKTVSVPGAVECGVQAVMAHYGAQAGVSGGAGGNGSQPTGNADAILVRLQAYLEHAAAAP